MTAGVGELPDRWILPLGGSCITEVDWDDTVRFLLDPPGEIAVGRGALLSHGPLTAPGADARTLEELGQEGTQRAVGARITSAVGFKNGALRVVLDSGWHLNVRPSGAFVPASVSVGAALTWSRDETSGPAE
jgi:Family of unknown function (DUF6188)